MNAPTRKPASRRRAAPAALPRGITLSADKSAVTEKIRSSVANAVIGTPENDEAEGLSKTRRKAQSHALQALGRRLVELPVDKLANLPLPEALRNAIDAARTITAREGRRRQLQYIGKLMRSVDADTIADALERDGTAHRREVAAMHAAESWREGLLDGSRSLTTFIERHPDGASRPLAQLLSQARRERDSGSTPRQARSLYRELLLAIEAQDLNADAADAESRLTAGKDQTENSDAS